MENKVEIKIEKMSEKESKELNKVLENIKKSLSGLVEISSVTRRVCDGCGYVFKEGDEITTINGLDFCNLCENGEVRRGD